MTRLILMLLLLASVVLAVGAVLSLFKPAVPASAPYKADTMQATFRNIAYVLLLALMMGVATGWLGAV